MVHNFRNRQAIRQITLSGKDELARMLSVMAPENKSIIRSNVRLDGTINRCAELKPVKDRYFLSWAELDCMARMIARGN